MTLSVLTLGTGTPVEGAVVRVEGAGSLDGDRRTDRDGMVSFSVGNPERGSMTVSAAGHFTKRMQLRDLARTTEPGGTSVVSLHNAADLLVRVLDQGGSPIQGAFVTAYPYDSRTGSRKPWQGWWPSFREPGWYVSPFGTAEEQHAGTDAHGEVTLLQLPCGPELLVSASGPIAPTTGVITMDVDARRAEIELRGDPGATIIGLLQYEDGTPAGSVGVSFHVADNLIQSKRATTAQNGSLRIVGVRAGRTSWQVDRVGTSLQVVDVVAPLTDLGTVTISRTTEISGVIEVNDGCSRAGSLSLSIDVIKEGQRVTELRPRRIGPGKMEFFGPVPEGRLELRLASQSTVLDSATVIAPSRTPIAMSAATGMAALELQVEGLPEESAVDALVVPLDERGVRSPRRGVIAASTVPGQMPIERQGNTLVLECLPPGTWDVEIAAGPLGGAAATEVVLRAGAREVRRVGLGWSTVRCIVRDREGVLLEGLEIGLTQGRDSPPDALTDESGTALFASVRPGRISVFPAIAGPHSAHAVDLVAEPDRVHSVEIVLDRPTRLMGRVRRNGEPEPGASVEAWARLERSSLGRWRRRGVTTDSEGAFAFSGVIPGEYELVANSNPDREPVLSTHYFASVSKGDPTVLEIDLVAERGIDFLVVDELGAPLTGMRQGYAIAGSGIGSLTSDPSIPGRLRGGPNQGPWILEIFTESYLGSANPMGDGEGSLVIFVPESAPMGPWGRLATIGRGSLTVVPTDDPGLAHVREVNVVAMAAADSLVSDFNPINVQFRRVDGALQVERLPVGITLQLVGVGKDGEWPVQAQVVVEGATVASWPPADG